MRSINALIGRVKTDDRGCDLAVDMVDRACDPFPEPGGAAVTELDGLVLAGGGAGRHRGHATGAGGELDLDLDGRVAPRVEDLPGVDVGDRSHMGSVLVTATRRPRLDTPC